MFMTRITSFQSSGAATVASGFATIATGGLALPVIGGLGAVAGVAGGVWNFMGSKKKDRVEKSILEHIKDIVEEDKGVPFGPFRGPLLAIFNHFLLFFFVFQRNRPWDRA